MFFVIIRQYVSTFQNLDKITTSSVLMVSAIKCVTNIFFAFDFHWTILMRDLQARLAEVQARCRALKPRERDLPPA